MAEVSGNGAGADDGVYVRGRRYVEAWRLAEVVAGDVNAAVAGSGFEVHAVGATDAAARALVRVEMEAGTALHLVCLLKRAAGSTEECCHG